LGAKKKRKKIKEILAMEVIAIQTLTRFDFLGEKNKSLLLLQSESFSSHDKQPNNQATKQRNNQTTKRPNSQTTKQHDNLTTRLGPRRHAVVVRGGDAVAYTFPERFTLDAPTPVTDHGHR
jgi:hypothetical protein